MKTLLFPLLSAVFLFSCSSSKNVELQTETMADSSMTSVDWSGVYAGSTTSDQEEKMHSQLILNRDMSFHLVTSYASKSENFFITEGKFSWDKSGAFIILGSTNEGVSKCLKVGENTLWEADEKGKSLSETSALKLSKLDSNFFELNWSLAQLEGEKVKSTGDWPTIKFERNGRVSGNGSCNRFSGSYILGGNGFIKFGVLAATKKMCTESMDLENAYFAVLNKVVSYSFEVDLLYLKNAEGGVLAVFKGAK